MEFEDVLVQVGDFGKYQRNLMLLFLFPSAALLPWFSMNIMFLVSVPDHWCYVPELEPWNLTIEQEQALIRPPADINNPSIPKCQMYDLNYTEFLMSSPDTNWTIPNNTSIKKCNNGWKYDKTYWDNTAASQWNMVCDDSHYTSLVLTLANVGSIFGTPLYGALSDRVGRKPTFFVTVLVTCVTAVSSILMTNFIAFLVLRTINGTLMPSIFQLPYIILLEIVGPNMRTRMNGIANSSWTFGLCFLPLIAWLSRDWVNLGLITSSVTVLFFLYWKILPESPRWLLSQERYTEATKIMTSIAQTNKIEQEPAELLIQLKKLGERQKKEKCGSNESTPANIFRYPQLRKKFLIITFCWVANITSYYGLQINISNLGGNEFVVFFLLSLAEIPGFLCSWTFMEKFGRRWCPVVAFIITGIACLVPVFTENSGIIPSILAKFGSSASFMAVYQQSSELYPTTIRALGMGLSGTVAGVATIAVPYVVYLAEYGKFIPFLIIALLCFMAAFSACFLPETLNENLPQTIIDNEAFGLHQKFFSCNRRRRPSCHEDRPPSLRNGRSPSVQMTMY